MLAVGLTGGIGCGKSTVAGLFAALDVPVLDADEIARELVQPGMPALNQIATQFGRQIVLPDGRLDRRQLRKIVFQDTQRRQQLEQILHPLIRSRMLDRFHAIRDPYAIAVIPLLLETGQTDLVERILVVDAPDDLRVHRVMDRDASPEQEVRAIMQTQWSRSRRLAAADDIVLNDGGVDKLKEQVHDLHRQYCALARKTLAD